MDIRQVVSEDHAEWLRMRMLLWPESLADHYHEISEFFAYRHPDTMTFVVDRGGGRLGGFLCFAARLWFGLNPSSYSRMAAGALRV